MQGVAIDGRLVSKLRIGGAFKSEDVVAGPHRNDLPAIVLTFYNNNREELGSQYFGPFEGTQAWKNYDREIRVPVGCREAILRVGLFGATGSASFDNIIIKKIE